MVERIDWKDMAELRAAPADVADKIRDVAKKAIALIEGEGVTESGMALTILAMAASAGIACNFPGNLEVGLGVFGAALRQFVMPMEHESDGRLS